MSPPSLELPPTPYSSQVIAWLLGIDLTIDYNQICPLALLPEHITTLKIEKK